MKRNIFHSLFTYRPRPNRSPLEDFTSEALVYLLSKYEILANAYLDIFYGSPRAQRNNIRLSSQVTTNTGRRLDILVRWHENGISRSLAVENKVWDWPWETEINGNPHTQVHEYCDYQDSFSMNESTARNNAVVLVSPYILTNYSEKEVGKLNYLGNFTWSDIGKGLRKACDSAREDSTNLRDLVAEFIFFLEANKMTGFENLTFAELASIKDYQSFEQKIITLNNSIITKFRQYVEGTNPKLQTYQAWGAQAVNYFRGIILHLNGYGAKDSPFWLFAGLAHCEYTQGEWHPPLILSGQAIPDIECGISIGFIDNNQCIKFLKRSEVGLSNWDINLNHGFELIISKEDVINLIRRRSLVSFISEQDQLQSIIGFLEEGINYMLDSNSSIAKIMSTYLEEDLFKHT